MFRENNQPGIFSFEAELSEKQRKLLDGSKEKWFHKLIFCTINENLFRPLYSNKKSRPNTPANILVSCLILKEMKNVSFDELMQGIMFDLRFKVALGLESINDVPFSRATIFNFQNLILEYEQQTGINLMEKVFDGLTAEQIKMLSLKTDIQRTDSTLISSNIRKYSRVQLLIEVLLRLYKILDDNDKQTSGDQLQGYLGEGSQHYVYGLRSVDLPHELEKLGTVYHTLHERISGKEDYQGKKEYINFERVYREHFIVVNQQVSPKPSEDLNSGMLQSPDDTDATYRKKKAEECKGFVVNGNETANPANPIQLINDIVVVPNNVDDSVILSNRIDIIKQKSPDLNELHTDGGYGSENNDKRFEELEITQITTAVRGRESLIEKKIEQTSQSPDTYTVECPGQKAVSSPTKQRHKVRFDLNICMQCPLKEDCQIVKNKGRYYFNHEDYLLGKRIGNIKTIPKERRKIRPNIEATMKEFKRRTHNGKVKVRGLFKTSLFAFNVGMAVNFGRIFRYLTDNELFCGNPVANCCHYLKRLVADAQRIVQIAKKSAFNILRLVKFPHFFDNWLLNRISVTLKMVSF